MFCLKHQREKMTRSERNDMFHFIFVFCFGWWRSYESNAANLIESISSSPSSISFFFDFFLLRFLYSKGDELLDACYRDDAPSIEKVRELLKMELMSTTWTTTWTNRGLLLFIKQLVEDIWKSSSILSLWKELMSIYKTNMEGLLFIMQVVKDI